MSKSTDIYHAAKEDVNVEEAGLINTPFITWNILKSKHNVARLPSYTFTQIDITDNKIISTLSKHKREAKLREKEKLLLQDQYKKQHEEETNIY